MFLIFSCSFYFWKFCSKHSSLFRFDFLFYCSPFSFLLYLILINYVHLIISEFSSFFTLSIIILMFNHDFHFLVTFSIDTSIIILIVVSITIRASHTSFFTSFPKYSFQFKSLYFQLELMTPGDRRRCLISLQYSLAAADYKQVRDRDRKSGREEG